MYEIVWNCTLIQLSYTINTLRYMVHKWSHIFIRTACNATDCWEIAYHYPSLKWSILATLPYQTQKPSANTLPTCCAASSTCCSRNHRRSNTAIRKSLLKLFCGFPNPSKHFGDCLCTLWTSLNVYISIIFTCIKSHIWCYTTLRKIYVMYDTVLHGLPPPAHMVSPTQLWLWW